MRHFGGLLLLFTAAAAAAADPWPRHTIDGASRGADGVRIATIDGQLFLATGWEEGGRIRVCQLPPPEKTREAWPVVEVGRVKSPEDAVLVDLDRDGKLDVVSSTEGDEQTVFAHFAGERWQTVALAATANASRWMFCAPLDIDAKHGPDLVVGSKQPRAQVSWLASPADPRAGDEWKLHPLASAGWIMSIVARDMDGDGDLDVLYSDRKGKTSGIHWLERPRDVAAEWPRHTVAAAGREVMFLDVADFDGDGTDDIVAAVQPDVLLFARRSLPGEWETVEYKWPARDIAGGPKGVCAADIDGRGGIDIALTCEGATGEKSGVWWCELAPFEKGARPKFHNIGGAGGVKFDLVTSLDVDRDGDLDLLTCEERDNLGVVWYENPRK